jgi:hypothetical protein
MEVQIRTRAMHEHAEHGVAAHWAYKEAGAKGYAGQTQAGDQEASVREARKAVLRQLLAWERDLAEHTPAAASEDEARIFVFTPQAAVVELCVGATPIDFAYQLHTELGHRIRGAKVDGVLVPLNTKLQSGTNHRSDGRQGARSIARLAERRARLSGLAALQGQGPRLVQRAAVRTDHRTRPRGGRETASA